MKEYRISPKCPVWAIEWTGENIDEAQELFHSFVSSPRHEYTGVQCKIYSHGGYHIAYPGDMIVRLNNDDVLVIKPRLFKSTFICKEEAVS